MGLFSALEPPEEEKLPRPLADRMRPRTLEELVGQQHLLAPGEPARARRLGRRTILFVDEIHRFNKAQQDAFLPYAEKGDIILIGATTENPSFEVISALLSRSRVYRLHPLAVEEILTLLRRALENKERGF